MCRIACFWMQRRYCTDFPFRFLHIRWSGHLSIIRKVMYLKIAQYNCTPNFNTQRKREHNKIHRVRLVDHVYRNANLIVPSDYYTHMCVSSYVCDVLCGLRLVAGRSPLGWLPIPDDFSPLLRFLPGERSGAEPGTCYSRHVGSAIAAQEQLGPQHRHSGRHHCAAAIFDELSGKKCS